MISHFVGISAALIILMAAMPLTRLEGNAPGPIADAVGGRAKSPVSCRSDRVVWPGPKYYEIELTPVPGRVRLHNARGVGIVSFPPSPFGIALNKTGQYRHRLTVTVEGMPPVAHSGSYIYVAWVMPPDLTPIMRLGIVSRSKPVTGIVDFNKFLVIVTREPAGGQHDKRWTGPILLRGMSKSGYMHSMAGHGPFRQEPCANVW